MKLLSAFRAALLLLGLLAVSGEANAACSSPGGDEGQILYASNINQMVFCNGTDWIAMGGTSGGGGGATALSGLTDVNTAGASTGSILSYNGTTWVVSSTAAGGMSALASLTDVSASSPLANQILRYNGSQSKWEAVSASDVVFSCPAGYALVSAAGRAYGCIKTTENSSTTCAAHISACMAEGARLPTLTEFKMAQAQYGYTVTNYAYLENSAGDNDCAGITSAGRPYGIGDTGNYPARCFIPAVGIISSTGSMAEGDRLVSGTLAMVANSATSYVSLSTNGTDWGYLSSGVSFLPTIVANKVSSTKVSATYLQLNSPTTVLACNSGFAGAIRYNTTTSKMEYCNGASWKAFLYEGVSGTLVAYGSVDTDGACLKCSGATITKGGTGVYTVNLATAQADANYSILLTGSTTTSNGRSIIYTDVTTSGFTVHVRGSSSNTATNQPFSFVVINQLDVSGGGTAEGDRITSGTTSAIAYENASLTISTAGTHRVTIGTNGAVGIGTVTPTTGRAMDIIKGSSNGIIQMRSADSPDYSNLILGISPDNYTFLQSTKLGSGVVLPLTFWAGANRAISISPTGYVGISRTNPLANLDVAGTISASDAIQVGGSSLACSSGIPGAIRYNGGSVQYCNGTAWTSLSSGTAAGVSSLASLTDVQISNIASRDYLRYDSVAGKWVNISESTVMSTTTMIPDWPDAIICNVTNPNWGPTAFYPAIMPYTGGDSLYHYRANIQSGAIYAVRYNSSGAFASYAGITTTDCNTSISSLYSSGKAFNFIGNAATGGGALGDRITSGTVSVTVNINGYISLTTGVTDWGYLSSGLSYLPSFRSTNISASSAIQVGSNSLTCVSGISGSIRYSQISSTMEYCNSTAWVSMGPSGTQPISFKATNGSAQSFSANTTTKLNFATEEFDTNNNFASSRFTATVPGKYLFTSSALLTGVTGGADIYIFKNGTYSGIGSAINGNVTKSGLSASGVLNLAVNDYVEVYGWVGSGSPVHYQSYNQFSGVLLSPQDSGGGGAGALNDLTDVDTSGAATGSIIAYNGANWVVSSSAAAGMSALASLTDVALTSLAARDYLRYDAGTSKWVNVSESAVMSTTTMLSNWPDAIVCGYSSMVTDPMVLYLGHQNYTSGRKYYYFPAGSTYAIFDADGTFNSGTNLAATGSNPCTTGTTIASLYAAGRAFNFIGNANTGGSALGDRITSGTVSVTVNTNGYISLTSGVTDWGYLSSGASYLPTLVASRVSATNVSATTIHTTGNVGIGTNSPFSKLHVQVSSASAPTPSSNNVAVFERNGNAELSIIGSASANSVGINFGDSADENAGRLFYDNSNNSMGFRTNGGNTALTINSSGLIGIGTSSPINSLHVSGSSWTGITVEARTNDPALQLTSDGGSTSNDWSMRMDVSEGDNLQWRYDNIAKVTIDVSGSMGIGSTAPKAKLDVIGTISASDAIQVGSSSATCGASIPGAIRYNGGSLQYCNTSAWTNLVSGTGGGVGGSGSANHVAYWSGADTLTYDASQLYWDATNNRLGIGNANLGASLDVSTSGSGEQDVAVFSGGIAGTVGSGARLYLSGGNGVSRAAYLAGVNTGGGANGHALVLGTSSNGSLPVERMRIDMSGNVGISTTNPAYRLHVVGDDSATAVSINSPNASVGQSIFLTANGRARFGYDGVRGAVLLDDRNATGTTTTKHIVFDTAGSERMRIYGSTGNVGIGTDTPSTTLYVNGQLAGGFGAMSTGGTLDFNDISNARPGSGYTLLRGSTASNAPNTTTYYWHPFSFEYSTKLGSGNLTQFAIPYTAGAGMYLRFRTSGTWSGWHRFIIENDSGNATVTNNLTAAAFLYSSDKRLKENIIPLTGGLAKLEAITPVTFRFISDTTHTERLGVIAQEVEKVYPQAVITGSDGYKKVDYPALVPVLIQAVKELRADNRGLQAANDNLRKDVDAYRATQRASLVDTVGLKEKVKVLEAANDNLVKRLEALEARKATMK